MRPYWILISSSSRSKARNHNYTNALYTYVYVIHVMVFSSHIIYLFLVAWRILIGKRCAWSQSWSCPYFITTSQLPRLHPSINLSWEYPIFNIIISPVLRASQTSFISASPYSGLILVLKLISSHHHLSLIATHTSSHNHLVARTIKASFSPYSPLS